MSRGIDIGFDLSLRPRDLRHFYHAGVKPVFIDIKEKAIGGKEPEPKIFLQRPGDFKYPRALFRSAANVIGLDNQFYEGRTLQNFLLDTKRFGHPTAEFSRNHHSLRFRFEMDGGIVRRDFSEKLSMMHAAMIGGCADRIERERACKPEESHEEGFLNFQKECRKNGDPAFCGYARYSDLSVSGAYATARTAYSVCVRHPRYPVLLVLEMCEDVFDVQAADLSIIREGIVELEFEAKQMWGELPEPLLDPRALKPFLYNWMTQIRDSICMATPGATVNLKSKAEIAREAYIHEYCLDHQENMVPGLTDYFECHSNARPILPDQYAMMVGDTIEATLERSGKHIARHSQRLFEQKKALNDSLPVADFGIFNDGAVILGSNDNSFRRPLAQPA